MNKLFQFKRLLTSFGYQVPKDAEFYLVVQGEHLNRIGMKVGQYTHSCHVDSMDFIVLLFCNDRGLTEINDYDDYMGGIERITE